MNEQKYEYYIDYNSLRISTIKPKDYSNLLNKILLCRHGKTSYNTDGLVQGSTDVPLSDIGIQETEKDAATLNKKLLPIKHIITSNMMRAKETTTIYSKYLNITQVTSTPLLREYGSGIWEGKKMIDLIKHDTYHNKWTEKPITYSFGNIPEHGESFVRFLERVCQGLSLLLELSNSINNDEKLLVISHATVNRAIRFLYMLSCDAGENVAVPTAQKYEQHFFYSQNGDFIKIPHRYFGIDTTNFSFVK